MTQLTQEAATAATANKPMNIQKNIEVWVTLGEHQVRLHGTCSAGMPGIETGPYFGCHCSYINNITVRPDWNSVKLLDGKSAPQKTDSWGNKTPNLDIKRLYAEYEMPMDVKEGIFKEILARYVPKNPGLQVGDGYVTRIGPHGITFVFMSDNINSYTPDFPKYSGIGDESVAKGLKTSEFAQWLMDNEIGIVTASPIGRNQFHQTAKNFSLTRAWIWMPPGHAYYAMPDSQRVTGLKAMPSRAGWMEDILATLPHLKDQAKTEGLEAVIGKQLFKGGKIPW